MSTGAEGVDGLAYSDAMLHYRVNLGGVNVNDTYRVFFSTLFRHLELFDGVYYVI